MVQNKATIFTARLDQEKDNFVKSIEQFKQIFEKIKKFNNLQNVNEYSTDAFSLKDYLTNAFEKVKQFHEREALFDQIRQDYPQLDELNNNFKPFYEITFIASEVEYNFKDWTH